MPSAVRTKAKSSSIDLATVPFSEHAIERFAERILGEGKTLGVLAWARDLARQMLLQSEEHGLTMESYNLRLVKNYGQKARYFVCRINGRWWRFVLVPNNDGYEVSTFEEVKYR